MKYLLCILSMLLSMTDNVMGMCCAYAGVFKSEILPYADFRGLTVCRKQGGLVTDYVYDDFGELRYIGTSYTGPNNPKDYNGDDSFQYKPKNVSEYGSMVHDMRYNQANAAGVGGALWDCRQEVIDADRALVQYNMACFWVTNSMTDRVRAAGTAATFANIVLFKKILQQFKK